MGEAPRPTLFRFAGFTLDLRRATLLDAGGQQVALRPKSFDVLRHLLENPGRLVPREELLERVWAGVFVADDNVTGCIAEVRRALGEKGPVLRTIPKRGYLLESDVTREATTPLGQVDARQPVSAQWLTPTKEEPHANDIAGAILPPLPDRPSLVVLPFANMSGNPEQEYFADGMSEELMAALSGMRWFFVIARGSAFTYKGRAVDVRQVGQDLGVRYVLEGSVRVAGGRARISCELAEAETGHEVWAERFDGDLADIFGLQDRVAEAVAGAIEPSLRAAEMARAHRKPTERLDAYDLYLRALPHVYATTRAGIEAALALLRRAVEIDPDFALAKAFAALSHTVKKTQMWHSPADLAEGARLAREALAASRDDPHTLSMAGQAVANLAGEFNMALTAVGRALVISPNSAQIASRAGWVHLYACEPSASVVLFRRAIRLSPLDPEMAYMTGGLGLAHLMAGNAEEALACGLTSVGLKPELLIGRRLAVAALWRLGRLAEARAAATELRALAPDFRLSRWMQTLWYRDLRWPETFATPLREAGVPD